MACEQSADKRDLWATWRQAAASPQIDAAIKDLYQHLDSDVAAGSPRCQSSGRCCHFDSFGHRLYVTGLEIAWFLIAVERAAPKKPTPQLLPVLHGRVADGCPYQIERLCSVHVVRPMSCRLFFCDPDSEPWQRRLYERYHGQIKALHDRYGLDYRYLEWRAGLEQAGAGQLASCSSNCAG